VCFNLYPVNKKVIKKSKQKTGDRDHSVYVSVNRDVLDASPDLVFIIDSNDTIHFANKVSERKLDVKLIGEKLRSFITGEFIPVYDKVRRVALTNGFYGDVEMQIKLIDKGILTGVFYLTRVGSVSDDSLSMVVFIRDISEQRRTEMQLLRFANAIHYAVNPLQITDAEGKIIYVNPAYERAFGFSKDELIGQNPNIVSSGKHSKRFWQKVWQSISGGNIWKGEIVNRNSKGELMYIELIISPIIDPSGRVAGFLGSHRDITEKRHLEEQLIRSQKMENIGTLAAGIAHEVGNPLTSISSLVQVIQRTTDDSFAKDKLELVKNQINRIAKIIRELVDFARPSHYEIKTVDLNKIIREAVNITRYGKKARHVNFKLELEDSLLPISVVPDQLIQVFINIIINALDAIETNNGDITLISRADSKYLYCVIKDTGKGIHEDELDKIFDPFYTTKKVGEGTGLGLWVSYGIIKNFGGNITVDSVVGRGTSVTISLPIKQKDIDTL
jgi:PAS domain S-box-containing protein